MKEKILTAIRKTLDAYSQKPNIDILLTENVIAAMQAHAKEQAEKTIPVYYIGNKQTKTDAIYKTGVWQRHGQKMVPVKTAHRMISENPSVYGLANPNAEQLVPLDMSKEPVEVVDEAVIEEMEREEDESDTAERDRLSAIADACDQVTFIRRKDDVVAYVKQNVPGNIDISLNLDKRASLEKYYEEAQKAINLYGLV